MSDSVNNMSRRDFVRNSALGASAVALSAGAARAYAANEKVRIAWIGYGGRAVGLMNHFKRVCPDAAVVAVCDLKQDRVDAGCKNAEQYNPKGYHTTDPLGFTKMLEKEKPDGVIIATAPNEHATVAVPTLEMDFNTFCEKPMDITVEKVDAMVAAARKSKGFFQTGTQRRSHPTYHKMMKAVHDGMVGEIMFLQGGWHWSRDPSRARVERDGGRLVEQSTHHTDVMSWAMGDIAPVRCVAMGYAASKTKPNEFTETHSSTTWEFPDGQLFSYTHLWWLPGKYDAEILKVFGTKGCMNFNQALYTGRDEKEERFGPVIGKNWDEGTPEQFVHFVDNIRKGEKVTAWANAETGRVSTFMCMMGRKAMVNVEKNCYEPSVVTWKDLHSTTDL